MKKLLVLFIAISFFASFALVACGPSGEQKPPAAKEEAKTAPARSCSRAACRNRVSRRNRAKRLHLRLRLHQHQQNSLPSFSGGVCPNGYTP